jgi:DNA-binding protein H-NS
MTGAAKIPSYATRLENEIAALRKQNDALVAALRETMSALSDIINASETEPYTPEELQRNTFGKPVADAYAALKAVK